MLINPVGDNNVVFFNEGNDFNFYKIPDISFSNGEKLKSFEDGQYLVSDLQKIAQNQINLNALTK